MPTEPHDATAEADDATAAPAARDLAPDDLAVGMTAEFDRVIDEATVSAFAGVSGDHNPLHVDAAYAASTNYGAPIAHGALQVGLASALIGMFLPGKRVLLMSAQARFPSPLYFPALVRVTGTVTAWSRDSLKGMLRVVVADVATRTTKAEVHMGFSFHDQDRRSADAPRHERSALPATRRDGDRPLVLLTGASGGLGVALVEELSRQMDLLAVTNRTPLPASLRELPGVAEASVDFGDADWPAAFDAVRGERPLWAVVHAAWPGMPKGGLLDASDDVIEQQLLFGTTHLVRLARYLAAHVGPNGGRLVAIGSIAGTTRPSIAHASYSLGKSALEQTVSLLAPELARKSITVNAICPPLLPVGMNRQLTERQRLVEMSRVPMGRLGEVSDVSTMLCYLLSDAAGFVSGQSLVLSGGQL